MSTKNKQANKTRKRKEKKGGKDSLYKLQIFAYFEYIW